MKRFTWPLQRLLDITAKRESALRSAVLQLSPQIARVHQQILQQRGALADQLKKLGARGIAERLAEQMLFLDFVGAARRRIEQLSRRLDELSARRGRIRKDLVKTRESRKALEDRRETARQEHIREQSRLEQKDLDENAHISFARGLRGPCRATRALE